MANGNGNGTITTKTAVPLGLVVAIVAFSVGVMGAWTVMRTEAREARRDIDDNRRALIYVVPAISRIEDKLGTKPPGTSAPYLPGMERHYTERGGD